MRKILKVWLVIFFLVPVVWAQNEEKIDIPAPAPVMADYVRLNANAKLPVSVLKIYDSGWFAVGTSREYLKKHNLGTERLVYSLYYSIDAKGTNAVSVNSAVGLSGAGAGGQLQNITKDTVIVVTSGNAVAQIFTGGEWQDRTNGYYKLIMLALED